jgi:general stress protein CsbA
MSSRETDTYTAIVAIAAVVVISVAAILAGYDHTLTKLGIAAVAGIAGFSIRGLIRWQ